MSKYNLSVVMPGIRKANWDIIYDDLQHVIGKYSFELVIAGPIEPTKEFLEKPNTKYIRDFGHPSRCTQIATNICEGELFMWSSDDGKFLDNGLEPAIDLWYQAGNEKNEIIMKYFEGQHPNQPDMTASGIGYWHAWFHNNLHLDSIPKHYRIAPVGMLNLNYFKSIGGLDCRFENNNMNVIDLCFRLQHDGGQMILPPNPIAWYSWSSGNGGILVDAYFQNDQPLFDSIYKDNINILEERKVIDYNNWIYNSNPIWQRRFLDPGIKVQS